MNYQQLQTEAQEILSNIKKLYNGPESDVDKYTMIREWGDNGVSIVISKTIDAKRADRVYEGRITPLRRKVNWQRMADAVREASTAME